MFSTPRILAVIFFFVLQLNAHMHLVGVQIRNRSLLFPPRPTGNIYAIFPQMQEAALVKVFFQVWPQLDSIWQKQNYKDANRSKEHQYQQIFSLLHSK
jgi:hypothetical protein